MFTPPHSWPANVDDFGVNLIGTNRTPGKRARFSASDSFWPSIQGAPTTSNGVSVPRPTDTVVDSRSPIPGDSVGSFRLRRLGDGFVQAGAGPAKLSALLHPPTLMTVRSAPIFLSAFKSIASSPIVRPYLTGIV